MITIYSFLMLSLFLLSPNGDARKGNEAYEKGNYEEAESYYRAALEQEADNTQILFNLSNALAKQGKVEEAVQSYLQYVSQAESAEDKARGEYNIGTLMAENEQWKPAVNHLRNALRYSPADPDLRHNYELAMRNAQDEEQEDQQQQEQENNEKPDPPTEYALAMKKRAEELVDQRKYNEAYSLMQQALSADPTVANFNDFINRIATVTQIESGEQ